MITAYVKRVVIKGEFNLQGARNWESLPLHHHQGNQFVPPFDNLWKNWYCGRFWLFGSWWVGLFDVKSGGFCLFWVLYCGLLVDFAVVISIYGLVSCLIWFAEVVWLFEVWKWLGWFGCIVCDSWFWIVGASSLVLKSMVIDVLRKMLVKSIVKR